MHGGELVLVRGLFCVSSALEVVPWYVLGLVRGLWAVVPSDVAPTLGANIVAAWVHWG